MTVETSILPGQITDSILSNFKDVVVKSTWGETSFFYNPKKILPHGVYFLTIKEKDGDNDKASNLARSGVFRLSIGIGPKKYEENFGPRPPRPAKGCAVDLIHDFTTTNELMPHPVYAWMGWACVLSPNNAVFNNLSEEITAAYDLAVNKFNKKISARN